MGGLQVGGLQVGGLQYITCIMSEHCPCPTYTTIPCGTWYCVYVRITWLACTSHTYMYIHALNHKLFQSMY